MWWWCWPRQYAFRFRHLPSWLVVISAIQVATFFTVQQSATGLRLVYTDALRTCRHSPPRFDTRLITSMFSHAHVPHLVSNIASQIMMGVFVECIHGHLRFLIVYLVGGLFGVLTFRMDWCTTALTLLERDQPAASVSTLFVGASPCVYALIGAIAAHLILNFREIHYKAIWCFGVILVLVLDVVLYYASPVESIAYASHFGGCVFGGLVGIVCLRNVVVRHFERMYVAVACFGLLMGSMMLVLPVLPIRGFR